MPKQGVYFFPVREWIRRHYKKIPTSIFATCNHCSELVATRPSSLLYDHLVRKHSNELQEEQKKDKRTHWTWDYYTTIIGTQTYVKCNICKDVINLADKSIDYPSMHLLRKHGISAPHADDMHNVSNDNTDTTIKKDETHSATSSKISKNTEQIGVLNKDVDNRDLDLSFHEDTAECSSVLSQSSNEEFDNIESCEEDFDFLT